MSPLSHVRSLLASLVLAGVVAVSSAHADEVGPNMPSDYVPPEFQQVGITEHLGDTLPLDVVLRDESGAEVKLGDYFKTGRPVAFNFVYHSCPMLCSMVLSGFVTSAREQVWGIGKDYDVISVSIDPKDTPQVAADKKAHWVKTYGRDPDAAAKGWHFLTGDAPAIKRLTEAAGFGYYYDARQKQYAHGAVVMLLTPQGKLARYLYGIEFPTKDFRFGLTEAAEGRGGSKIDHLLLYCYQYDPTSRGYVLVAWRVMRIGAGASALALGGLLAVLWSAERKRKPLDAKPPVDPGNPGDPASEPPAGPAGPPSGAKSFQPNPEG